MMVTSGVLEAVDGANPGDFLASFKDMLHIPFHRRKNMQLSYRTPRKVNPRDSSATVFRR